MPHAYTVDAMGPQSAFLSVPSYQPLRDVADGRGDARPLVGDGADGRPADGRQLRRGLAEGRAPMRGSVRRVIAQLDELLARPTREGPLLAPLQAEHRPAGATDVARFEAA